MGLYTNSFLYPPVLRGKITDIYPWNFANFDHLFFFAPNDTESIIAKIKENIGISNIFFLDSGRSALTLAIKSVLTKQQNEVLIPSFCCPAVADSVLSAGGIPVFIDVNERVEIDLKSAKRGITDKTLALVTTNTYGLIDKLDEVEKFCRENKIFFINDLAQVPINSDKSVSSMGDLTIFSFGPEKHIFSLGGGALVVNNHSLIENVKIYLPNQTVSFKETVNTFAGRYRYYFKFIKHKLLPRVFSFNEKHTARDINIPQQINPRLMNHFQLNDLLCKLRHVRKSYFQLVSNFNYLQSLLARSYVLKPNLEQMSPPLYFTLRIGGGRRYELSKRLDEGGVCSVWNYFPLYYYEAYNKFRIVNCRNTEVIWQEVLSIPFRDNQTKQALVRTADLINSFT